eukprot:2743187-Pyramimonas_sp.AAC.1
MTRRSASAFLLLFLNTQALRADPAAFWADAATLGSARPNQTTIVRKVEFAVRPKSDLSLRARVKSEFQSNQNQTW